MEAKSQNGARPIVLRAQGLRAGMRLVALSTAQAAKGFPSASVSDAPIMPFVRF
jgi:hypothetical protein